MDKRIRVKVKGEVREFKDMKTALMWAIAEELQEEEYRNHGEGD